MKKHIVISIITCTLMSCNTSFSMLTVLRTQQRSHQHHSPIRMCHTNRTVGSLSKKTIFNASQVEISTNAPDLLEDLYDRNNNITKHLLEQTELSQKIMKTVRHQNIIAINHTYHEAPLDLVTLKSTECDVKKDLDEYFRISLAIHRLTLENKVRGGHADQ